MTVAEYYWEGKGPLWKVYWIYGVLLSVVLAAIVATAGSLRSHSKGLRSNFSMTGSQAAKTTYSMNQP
jgi:hypothetical protein